ncbi:hypothetical protein [Shimazuella kribbensis]|uniref:hypothetical protein n=1 Tax=Shimazuella kribbensis TaxID=139808 RepID=UPI00048E110D|nr:hypothetical protein [Shimazuella kribbensis]
MKQFRRFMTVFLGILILLLFLPSLTEAANTSYYVPPDSGDMVPKEETDEKSESMFRKYGKSTFILDYKTSFEEKELSDCQPGGGLLSSIPIIGALEMGGCALGVATDKIGFSIEKYFDLSFYLNIFNTMFWQQFLIITYFIVKWISWAFSMEIITYILDAYKVAMKNLEKSIWEPFMYLMWTVAVAWMVYYWISGKKTQLWTTFLNSLIIIALSTSIFANLPTFLQSVSNASTNVSILILAGLIDSETQEKVSKDLTKSNAEKHRKIALNTMEEGLDGIFIDLPYMLINFGSPELANKLPWQKVLDPPLGKDRNDVLQDAYDNWSRKCPTSKAPSGGTAKLLYNYEQALKREKGEKVDIAPECAFMHKMKWMTADKAPQRLSHSIIIMMFSFVAMMCFAYIAFLTIIWQFIALGRGLLAAVYLLISLWPGYGMKEAAMWGWSMIQALFMKVFYTIVLAIYIKMVTALASKADDIGFLNIWLLAIGMFIGLIIAMRELRTRLSNIPLGNGMFLQGTSNEAELVMSKIGGAVKTTAGIGSAVALTAAGMPHGARVAMTVATKGVKGAIKQEATNQLGGGKDSIASKIQKNRAEKLEKQDAQIAYQKRTDGLLPEDKAMANHIYDVSGIDVTTPEGRTMLNQVAPQFAKNNSATLGRIDQHTLAQQMTREMPKHMPPPGSLELEMLSRRFGAENVELWQEAASYEWKSVENKLDAYNNLSLKEKTTTPKPSMTNSGVQKQFEKLQLGNRLHENSAQVRVDAKNAIGDEVYASFSQLKYQMQKNEIGVKVYDNFKKQVANSGTVVLDLNQIQIPPIGKIGAFGNESLNVKVTGNFKQHLPNTAEEAQKMLDLVQKQIYEQLRTEGYQADKITQPINLKVDMPIGGGGTFGTQKVDVQVSSINMTRSGDSNVEFDAGVLRNQINQILRSAPTTQSIPLPNGKTDLQVTMDLANFVATQSGMKKPTESIELSTRMSSDLIIASDHMANEIQKRLNFVRSNPTANLDAFASSDTLNKFMKQNEEQLQKQIERVRHAMNVQASIAATMRERLEEDMENIIKSFKKVSQWQKEMKKKHNTPSNPPSDGSIATKM